MRLVFSFLNILLFTATIITVKIVLKNIDDQSNTLIKLKSCEHTMHYQDKVLREIFVREAIYEE